jgi:hypothetical protein
VQPALPGDQLLPGTDVEMIGISKYDLCPELVKLDG